MKKALSLLIVLCMALLMTVPGLASQMQKPEVKYEVTVGEIPINRYLLHKSQSEEYLDNADTIPAGTKLQVVDELTIDGTVYCIYLDSESESMEDQPPSDTPPGGPDGQNGRPDRPEGGRNGPEGGPEGPEGSQHEPPTRPPEGEAPSGPPPAFCFKQEDLKASQEATTAVTTTEAESTTALTETTSKATPTQAEETGTTADGTEQTSLSTETDGETDGKNNATVRNIIICAIVVLGLVAVVITILRWNKKKAPALKESNEESTPEDKE